MQTKSRVVLLKQTLNLIKKFDRLIAFNDGMKELHKRTDLDDAQFEKAKKKLMKECNIRLPRLRII